MPSKQAKLLAHIRSSHCEDAGLHSEGSSGHCTVRDSATRSGHPRRAHNIMSKGANDDQINALMEKQEVNGQKDTGSCLQGTFPLHQLTRLPGSWCRQSRMLFVGI
mmetsp:Transcript_314/g.748  ORF Transcript_314/g.748 Transcript_314/m.748 type:complete len:106 (-) Transcript_314:82-399(-)